MSRVWGRVSAASRSHWRTTKVMPAAGLIRIKFKYIIYIYPIGPQAEGQKTPPSSIFGGSNFTNSLRPCANLHLEPDLQLPTGRKSQELHFSSQILRHLVKKIMMFACIQWDGFASTSRSSSMDWQYWNFGFHRIPGQFTNNSTCFIKWMRTSIKPWMYVFSASGRSRSTCTESSCSYPEHSTHWEIGRVFWAA